MIEIIPNWHPVFVHFTVALLSTSTVFFLFAFVFSSHRWRDQWLTVAYWNMWLGIVAAVATGITGWFAFNSVVHDTPSHAAMTDHRNWALATLAFFIPLSAWSVWRFRARQAPSLVWVGLLLVASSLLMTTAWRGGEVVYRYGLGVMSMPKVSNDAHGKSAPAHRDADDGHQHSHD